MLGPMHLRMKAMRVRHQIEPRLITVHHFPQPLAIVPRPVGILRKYAPFLPTQRRRDRVAHRCEMGKALRCVPAHFSCAGKFAEKSMTGGQRSRDFAEVFERSIIMARIQKLADIEPQVVSAKCERKAGKFQMTHRQSVTSEPRRKGLLQLRIANAGTHPDKACVARGRESARRSLQVR